MRGAGRRCGTPVFGLKLGLIGFVGLVFGLKLGSNWVCFRIIGFEIGFDWVCFDIFQRGEYSHNPLLKLGLCSFYTFGNWVCFAYNSPFYALWASQSRHFFALWASQGRPFYALWASQGRRRLSVGGVIPMAQVWAVVTIMNSFLDTLPSNIGGGT